MNDVNYVDLLIGEVLLGDVNNTYLYVCEDENAEAEVIREFVTRVEDEGQLVTAVRLSSGVVVVNSTQRFYFASRTIVQCVAKGTTYDRIFIDLKDDTAIRSYLMPMLTHPGGDFV